MKKRLMSLLLVCSMILSLFTGLSVTALAGDSDFEIIDGTELYQYTGTDTDVVIPDGITRIDEGAFAYNEFIESVTIPASVVTIAEYAFSGCEYLTKVTFLGKCIDIDAFSFDDMGIMEVHCRAEDVDWYSYQGFSEDYIKGDVGGSTGTCAHENETEDVTTSAGCTTPGSKVITCEDCGAELRTVTIPALGHLEKDEIITAATCETAGSKNVVCTRCSNTITINNVEIKALGHNIVAGKCTREGCDYTEPAQEDLFQKFFESRTADMTAVNSTDKAWTALPSGLKYKLKASGSEEKVFTLAMKKGGYLTVKGTVSQPMAKVTATDANKKMVSTLSSTSYMPTTTAFEATVKHGDVITFTVSSYTYATDSYYVEITDITLDETCPHSALDAVARTAYKSTNLRFAHGLSAANYTALDDCDSMQTGDVCSAMRMLQRVQKIVVTMDVQKDAQITIPAVISGTNATVDSSKMSDALDKLADNGLLTVDASNSSSTGLSFTLPSADVRKLADKNVKLELITALGSVTLDAASLKGFGGKELVLTIEKFLRSTLSAALQKELDPHAAIYSVTATCGGAAATSLGSSTLSKLTAAYVSGSVSFETSVLATFAVDVPDKQNSVTIPPCRRSSRTARPPRPCPPPRRKRRWRSSPRAAS